MQGLRVLEQNFDVNLVNFFFSVEVILRAEAVEQAQAGDKCDFTGSLIVVPDVAQISTPGKMPALHKGTQNSMLKTAALGNIFGGQFTLSTQLINQIFYTPH